MFRLHRLSEDDTIFLFQMCTSSGVYSRPGVGSAGAVLFYCDKSMYWIKMLGIVMSAPITEVYVYNPA